METDLAATLNTHELAWAAGFFDGEGSAGAGREKNRTPTRVGSVKIWVGIAQVGDPSVLIRFQRAIGGFGAIRGPYQRRGIRQPVYHYAIARFEFTQHLTAVLWRYLSNVKRQQLKTALLAWRCAPRHWFKHMRNSRTVCSRGHLLTPNNIDSHRTGNRCRQCRQEWRRLARRKVA